MTKDELIANQQIEIEEQRELLSEYKLGYSNIYGIIFCIGGPLNDNKLMYSHKQLGTFSQIAEIVKY